MRRGLGLVVGLAGQFRMLDYKTRSQTSATRHAPNAEQNRA